MNSSNSGKIDEFFSIVNELKESIYSIKNNGKYLENHRLTLIISLIDFLSKSYKPSENSNRIRFNSLILDMSREDYLTKISVPQLYYYLQKDTSEELSTIRKFIEDIYKEIPHSKPIDIDIDIDIDVIKGMWPTGYKYNGKKVFLENFQHIYLIWMERNSLIHEMRRRTLGESFFLKKERPYYIYFIGKYGVQGFDGEGYFELSYPDKIYYTILENCIINLREYFIQNKIDPFVYFNLERLIAVKV